MKNLTPSPNLPLSPAGGTRANREQLEKALAELASLRDEFGDFQLENTVHIPPRSTLPHAINIERAKPKRFALGVGADARSSPRRNAVAAYSVQNASRRRYGGVRP